MKKEITEVVMLDEMIMNRIFILRKQKIMLDKDLAELYGVKPIRLREQLKRNIGKFPTHFMFQLSELETEIMVSQNAIPSKKHLGGALPFVFTEHGVLQLANILKSERATQMSIRIIEVFVKMREMLLDNAELRLAIEGIRKKTENNTKNIEVVFQYLDELLEKKEKQKQQNQIGFKTSSKNQ